MRGTIARWGDDLASDLARLTGGYALILIGPGPVEARPTADISEQRAAILAARERWGTSFLFHLFSPEVEYRWDHGSGRSLALADDGPYDVWVREYFLLADADRAPGVAGLHRGAPTGRVRVQEFALDGRPVDLKLEALI